MAEPGVDVEYRRFRRRVRVVLAVLLGGLGLVLVRSAQLQITQHEALSQMAREQTMREIKIPARRGHIYDRNGKPLAISVDVPSVYANPQMIPDPRLAARSLAQVLGLDVNVVYQRLASEKYFVWLKRQVSPEMAEQVKALGIRGVDITKEPKRFYPNRQLAAHVLGFAGLDGRGLEGIERAQEDSLAGQPQGVLALRDARGNKVLERGLHSDEHARGSDVYLTLDSALQHSVELALQRGVKSTRAKSGMAVVLEQASADVLALAVEPQFNPNNVARATAANRRNRVMTDVFEPGSTLKPFVVAAALEHGAVKPNDIIYCEKGSYSVGSHTIRDSKPHQWLDLKSIVQKSSNVGIVKIGKQLGKEKLGPALRRFGFGRAVGLSFPGETAGLLRDPARWSPVGEATIAFGHGMAVTSMQLAAAYRVLAAAGMYRTPRLIRRIDGKNGGGFDHSLGSESRVLSAQTANLLKPMLVAAAGPEGTGFRAQVSGYGVAGKTGTAQKIDPVTGGYSSDKFIASFAGFLPANDPRVVIVVVVDEPHDDEHTGGSAAAPIFAEIGAAAMQHLGVLPSADILVAKKTPPVEQRVEESLAMQAPEQDDEKFHQSGVLPSFLGLTARQAVARYNQSGLNADLHIEGSGLVVQQKPSPGSEPAKIKRLQLVLQQR